MKLEHYPVEKLKKEILEIVGKHLDLQKYRVFFFGSRVNGQSHERSDIDIGIEGPEKIEDVMWKIVDDIGQLDILYKIDVVSFIDADKNFLEVASQAKEYLN